MSIQTDPPLVGERKPRRDSLASHAGKRVSLTVSTLILLSHGFFFYAQLSGKANECGPSGPNEPGPCPQHKQLSADGLMKGNVSISMSFEAAGPLKLGLDALTTKMCYDKGRYVDCPEGRETASTDVCSILECGGFDFGMLLLDVGYFYSINHMWILEAEHGQHPGRPAAGLLFWWSFVWPHVKLLLLHLFFYLPVRQTVRRNVNYWLAFWGKWSLADVLVMAAVLALFDLDLNESIVDLWANAAPNFRPMCDAICLESFDNATNLSRIDFHNGSAPLPPSDCAYTCDLFADVLSTGVTPATLPQSNVHVRLWIEGLAAMYSFCTAVLISLSTGVWLDSIDDKLLLRRRRKIAKGYGHDETALNGPRDLLTRTSAIDGPPPLPLAPPALGTALLPDGHNGSSAPPPGAFSSKPAAGGPTGDGARVAVHVVLVLAQLVAVVGAIRLPAFERKIAGSLGSTLRVLGVEFDKPVALWDLPAMTARGGGMDYFMAATFSFFIIIAPIVRAFTLLALLVLPLSKPTARRLCTFSRRLVAYTALDVMLIATPVIGIAFGPLSQALVSPEQVGFCKVLDQIFGTVKSMNCLRIDVIPSTGYWFNVAAVLLYCLSGFDGSPTANFIHRRLFEHDQKPPPNCCSDAA